MRVKNSLFWFFCLAVVFSLASCKGDEGPIGPAGPAGPAGPEGPQGGDAAQGCMDCHANSQVITAKLYQWEHSVHATGGHQARNTSSCAVCHTSQGFLERIASGAMETTATIDNPLPQNCYTCHQIHSTYTDADWAFTAGGPVTLWKDGSTVDGGKGNVCIQCHQARVEEPTLLAPGAAGTITITSKRYGPHHGPQGMLFNGTGGYEVGTGYENSAHKGLIPNACVTCHMATVKGAADAGGHTFAVADENGNINTAGCATCHTDNAALLTLVDEKQTEILDLLDQLRVKLVAKGLLDADDYAIVPQDFTADQAGALYNFQFIKEDRSEGVHNYKYAKKLLENSIAALN